MDLQAFPFLPSIAVIGEKRTEKSVIFLKNYPLLPIMKITSSGNPRAPFEVNYIAEVVKAPKTTESLVNCAECKIKGKQIWTTKNT